MKHKPDSGYNFEEKIKYRKQCYSTLEKAFKNIMGKSKSELNVMYLESSDAAETEFLLNRGYQPENLIPVNFNPAEIAHVNRKFPDVHGRGVDIARALAECGRKIHIIHLDFCGNYSRKTMTTAHQIRSQSLLKTPVGVIVNLMRGREKKELMRLIIQKEKDAIERLHISGYRKTQRSFYKNCIEKAFKNNWLDYTRNGLCNAFMPEAPKPPFSVLATDGQYQSSCGLTFQFRAMFLGPWWRGLPNEYLGFNFSTLETL